MHGERETSMIPRASWTGVHLILLALAGWLYFGGGIEQVGCWLGRHWQAGDLVRRSILFAFGVVMWLRMTITAAYLLRRKFGWGEFVGVVFATAVYQIGFAMLGAGDSAPLGMLDYFGIILFSVGSYLNTASEFQRKRFKDDPAHQGRLYTQGLFRLARHINYFGDALWVTGWAILTSNAWAALIPVALTAAFVGLFIPSLSTHLRQRYGHQYDAWAAHTKAFIPFVY